MTTTWHGVTLDDRTAAMMDAVVTLLGHAVTPTQGSYSTSVGASGTTHAGGGAIDIVGGDLTALVAAMRQVGFAAWHRTPAQGFIEHVHGIAVGCPDLSATAASQVQAYFAGRDGLIDNAPDDGPRDWVGVTWETYSGGTYVPPSGGTPVTVFGQYPGDRSGCYGDLDGGGTLAGTPSFEGDYSNTFDPGQIDVTPPPLTLHMHAGDSVFLAVRENWPLGLPPAGLTRGLWMVRSTGTGTLDVADSYDLGYNYPTMPTPPTWVPRTFMGADGGDIGYWNADPVFLDDSHLWNDGWPLIKLTCSGGPLDITWVGMQIEQPQGFFLPDGGFAWSAPQPAIVRAADTSDGTFAQTSGGGGLVWSIDGEAVPPDPTTYTAGSGSAALYVRDDSAGSQAAIADAIAHAAPELGSASLATYDAGLVSTPISPGGQFGYAASFHNYRLSTSSPSKAVMPAQPDGYSSLDAWLAEDFEWLGTTAPFWGWDAFPTPTVMIGGTTATGAWQIRVSVLAAPGTAGFTLYSTLSADLTATRLASSDQYVEYGVDVVPEDQGQASGDLAYVLPDGTGVATAAYVPLFSYPSWRYKVPTFVAAPTFIPTITDPEDAVTTVVTYLRNKQRNDGLGAWSAARSRGVSSQQRSIRNRGYR